MLREQRLEEGASTRRLTAEGEKQQPKGNRTGAPQKGQRDEGASDQ